MTDSAGSSGPGDAPSQRFDGAAAIIRSLTVTGGTLAVAESLTGGSLTAALVASPGASMVLRGGLVAYATDLKAGLLGVDAGLLDRHGPVHPDVARQMAAGVAQLLKADHAVATTGVAGPGPSEGEPAGTAYVAVTSPTGTSIRELRLAGLRPDVSAAVVGVALTLLGERTHSGAREQTGPAIR